MRFDFVFMFLIGNLRLDNDLIMAPMAGITNLPFRVMVKRMGAGLVTTEMISAVGLTMNQKKTVQYLRIHPEERPVAVQIFGAQPHSMAKAAERAIEAGADIIDINMGCPAKKVVKTGAGGALLRDAEKIREIISAVRRVCNVPLTIKIRAGWSRDKMAAPDISRMAQDCGVDAITVHARSVTQGFSGHADWNIIEKVKERVQVPVIGNGDVSHPGLVAAIKAQTGCDGVMIGRAAIGTPWIFRQAVALARGLENPEPAIAERKTLIMDHFKLLSEYVGVKRASRNMRGLLLWYTKGLPHSRRFRGLFTSIHDLATLTTVMNQYFSALEDHDNEG